VLDGEEIAMDLHAQRTKECPNSMRQVMTLSIDEFHLALNMVDRPSNGITTNKKLPKVQEFYKKELYLPPIRFL
jgi:hypothetical protein